MGHRVEQLPRGGQIVRPSVKRYQSIGDEKVGVEASAEGEGVDLPSGEVGEGGGGEGGERLEEDGEGEGILTRKSTRMRCCEHAVGCWSGASGGLA